MIKLVTIMATVCMALLSSLNAPGQAIYYEGAATKAVPFNNTEVILSSSWIKNRENINTRFLKSLDVDRLLHNFRVNAGLPSHVKPLDGWEAPDIGIRGHFAGHYLSAVSLLVEKYQDQELSQRLAYMVSELHKCQQALGGGYLSAFPAKDFQTLETNYNNGVWAPYYTCHKMMQGLLDVYVRTGNKEAYQMVTDLASFVKGRMDRLSPDAIEKILYTAAANPANEAGAMNDVLYKLYKISKKPEHLDLAKVFDRDWFSVPLSRHEDILSGLHSNTHLVLVNGFTQRYDITQEKKYHDAAVNFWNMLIKHHAYVNGSSSGPRPNATTKTSETAEHWGIPGVLSNTLSKEIAESCVSHNTQKLTSTLFTWNPDPGFADVYMNAFYNAVLPTQNDSTGQSVYHLPLGSPQTKQFLKENDFRCCNGTCVEAFAALNAGIYYHDASNIWVNLYIPSAVHWAEKGFQLQQKGNFPEDTLAEFTVTASSNQPLSLNFFIPSRAAEVDVYVNGAKEKGKVLPGTYFTLRRIWKNKDVVKLVFHYCFHIETMPDDKKMIALFYGPVLLAFETRDEVVLKKTGNLDSTVKLILGGIHRSGQNKFQFTYNGFNYVLQPLYKIRLESYGVYATIRDY